MTEKSVKCNLDRLKLTTPFTFRHADELTDERECL